MKQSKRAVIFVWSGVLFLPLVLFGCAWYRVEQAALLTFLAAIVATVPFFVTFERTRPRPRDLMPIVVMAALAAAGRLVFGAFPSFKPVSAIVIVTGIVFGPQSGFMTGALAALASNLFFGHGPWTPWQMYAWGLIGFLAGILQQRKMFKHSFSLFSFGFGSGLLFGLIMDSYHVIGFVQPLTGQGALLAYSAGIPFNLTHAVATVLFLIPIHKVWIRQLSRIKLKYGIQESNPKQL